MNPDARGASVFALSQSGASSSAARWMANRENAADLVGGANVAVKDQTVMRAILDMSTTAQIKDSLKLGGEVLGQIGKVGKLHKGSVEQAGFAVLKAPDVPSILVESAFISNPDEERKLKNPEHKDRLATAINAGVPRYFYDNPPAGTRVAVLAARERGQALRHVVSPGETLVAVAGRYAVGIDELRRTNHLETETVASGTVLEIPVTGT
jgi:N-acetylmuramoyl-L-alanine amidase